jgi:hypothetical protein
MHVWYELEDRLTTEKNDEVEALLKKHKSELELKKAAIKAHEAKLADARSELKDLEDAAAQFGLFLKMNSITPYNDEMLAYMDEQIKEEKQIVNSTRASQDRLDGLVRTRKEYEQQIRILEREMEAGSGKRKPLDERDIEKMVQKLYRLKGWGQSLRDIKTAAEYYGGSRYQERHFRAPRSWPRDNAHGSYAGSGTATWTPRALAPLPYRGGPPPSYSAAVGPATGAFSNNGYTYSGPPAQRYASLLPPVVGDDEKESCAPSSSSSTPRYFRSPAFSEGQGITMREVEPPVSSRLRTGFMARLLKGNKPRPP